MKQSFPIEWEECPKDKIEQKASSSLLFTVRRYQERDTLMDELASKAILSPAITNRPPPSYSASQTQDPKRRIKRKM